MTDYSELKRLAEAATPGRNFDRLPMAGGGLKYECTGDDGSLVLKVDHKNDEWGFVGDNGQADEEFFLACTPSTVLALIAENEQYSSRLHDVATLCATVEQERDQLKAENEALRKRIDDMSPIKGAPLTGPDLKCLACGGYHYGMSGLPCPKMAPMAQDARDD